MNDTLVRLQRAIDFVEARLFDELPLATIARAATCSPWHFHRLFTSLTGETPASYVRKRRLADICRRLVETKEPLVDLALGCGFESQATFTRAFTRDIGVSPGRFRKERLLAVTHRYPPLDLAALLARARREFMEPRIVRLPAFHIVGMAGRFTPATTSHIPLLWERFVPCMDRIPYRRRSHTLGVCVDADPSTIEQDGFTYVAGVEVERIGAVPEGLMALTVPANAYAVFTHTGHIAHFPDTVKQVWGRWLPASRYRHVPAPDLEWYDEQWNPETGEGEIDIYVPVADG